MSDALSRPTASSADAGGAEQHDTPLLQLVSVTKRFGGLAAVDDLSFSLQKGEILGVIGPNGAGKSTMVNIIVRTFQVTQPFMGLDVRENVMVGAFFGQQGRNLTKALRVADEVLERVNLAHKATFKGDQLTVADRKRLEMARALAPNPQLLLLDEGEIWLHAGAERR